MNIEAFNNDLHKIDWDVKELNAHQYGNNFLNAFNQILDIHAPLTKVNYSKNQAKRNAKPWICNDILKLIKNKDKTYQKFIKEENISIKEQLFSRYKQQKNEITKLIRNSKNVL